LKGLTLFIIIVDADSASCHYHLDSYVMQPASRTSHASCSFPLCIATRCLSPHSHLPYYTP